jgi:hypothetical protein
MHSEYRGDHHGRVRNRSCLLDKKMGRIPVADTSSASYLAFGLVPVSQPVSGAVLPTYVLGLRLFVSGLVGIFLGLLRPSNRLCASTFVVRFSPTFLVWVASRQL